MELAKALDEWHGEYERKHGPRKRIWGIECGSGDRKKDEEYFRDWTSVFAENLKHLPQDVFHTRIGKYQIMKLTPSLTPSSSSSLKVKCIAPGERFNYFLGHFWMLLPEVIRRQPFHLLKIGSNNPGIGGVKVVLQRSDSRKQLRGDHIAKTFCQSLVVSVRHCTLTPSRPKLDRLDKLRGI